MKGRQLGGKGQRANSVDSEEEEDEIDHKGQNPGDNVDHGLKR